MSAQFQSGFFVGESAWHKLGTVIPTDDARRFNHEEALCLAGACFDVVKQPQFVKINDEDVFTGSYATIRTDTNKVLGTVGERYQPLQNLEQFAFFQPFLDTKEVAFETAGVLKGGAVVWALARILTGDGVVDVDGGDTINKYLMTYTSHDGSLATGVAFCPIRTVCWNTLSMNLSSDMTKQLKVRHTQRQLKTLGEIRETVSLMDREFQMTAEQFRSLKRKIINKDDMVKFCKIVFEAKEDEISTRLGNIIDRCVDLAHTGMGNEGESLWDVYNGVTQWLTYERGKDENRLHQNQFGPGALLNKRALETAFQLAK
jgi:phage/plasmid-like protein (TIGR03299 family)